jgi:hypothetical protein
VIAARNDLVHVHGVGEAPAEPRAIVHGDTARLVEKHPDHPMVTERRLFDVHQLVAMLLRKGFGELANFFPDFHFRSRADKKRSGRTCPTPARTTYPNHRRSRQAANACCTRSSSFSSGGDAAAARPILERYG